MRFAALLLGLLVSATPAPSIACSCGYLNPKHALARADAVFAGTIEEVIQIERSQRMEERIIVRFKVGRVWKGDVGAQFTMHTFHESSMCIGLMGAEEGEELLVFAYASKGVDWKSFHEPTTPQEAERLAAPGSEREVLRQDLVDLLPGGATVYTTSLCSGTTWWTQAGELSRALGPYRTPKGGHAMHDAPSIDAELAAAGLDGLPYLCRDVFQGLERTDVIEAPANAAELEELLSQTEHYPYSSADPPTFVDRWFREDRDFLALCRVPKAEAQAKDCGAVAAGFLRRPKVESGKWALTSLNIDPCEVAE